MSSVLAGRGSKSKSKSLETDRGRAHLKAGSQRPNDYLQRPKDLAPVPKPTETVLVAVNAAKEITKHALEWALTNVAQEGDHITLLALLPGARNVRRIWGLPMLAGDCANASTKNVHIPGNHQDIEEQVGNSCSHVMQELHKLCDTKKVKVSVKVVQSAGKGTTAMEAHRVGATWVVLDRQLKKEEKCCLEKLQCNLVIVKPFSPKIVRLNLNGSPKDAGKGPCEVQGCDGSAHDGPSNTRKGNFPASDEATPSSSPETDAPFTTTEQGTSSNSSSEPATSPPTSSETHAHKTSDYKCADSSPWEDDAGAEAISETGTESDSSLVDAVSESDSGESGPLCTTTSESPEPTSFKFPVGFSRPFDPMAQSWFESRRAGAQLDKLDSVSVELWKTSARRRPDSATGTPKANSKQGRTSTPASPLNAAKKLSGNGRLSFSMREGSSSRNLGANPHPVNSPLGTSLKNGVVSHRRLPPESIKSTRQPFASERVAGVSRRLVTAKDLLEKFSEWDQEAGIEYGQSRPRQGELERTSSVRKAVSLSRHVPAGPPPLCSICQHKAPVFGKPPRRFTFEELELATGGFSQANFLAEGGFGSVHRGVLPDGQAVAVKQHKLASSQGDIEFCSEVEVLSCAQHRNVVMLNGYCIEDKRRLLVYEFICNGSLDSHLYGRDRDALEWPARQKIAVGAARGLRYLHEECRVGCIVHRDMRPNNILLTHDFEPMVGDFGLARWQPDGDLGVQTRVLGTFGYLAPEYAQSGQITEKADVYSFGVVLLELVTGRKAVDLNRPKGQQCLTEWARPLLEVHATEDMIDPRLDGYYSDYEVYCMLHAASLCIRKDPHLRPRMSQVLRILEGDIIIDTSGSSTPLYSSKLAFDHAAAYGSRSSRISSEYVVSRLGALSPPPLISYSGSIAGEAMVGHSGKLSLCGESIGKLSYQALKAAYKDRGNVRRLSYEDL